ncbi:hypothetical protein VNI00_017127 [Paramarasmius palmivorus]|uniref:Uncharacterized protein n=1 Tax=Paramarasmius palmivorus TaxID=297713 RepID=A0AAW0B736_9AGAR
MAGNIKKLMAPVTKSTYQQIQKENSQLTLLLLDVLGVEGEGDDSSEPEEEQVLDLPPQEEQEELEQETPSQEPLQEESRLQNQAQEVSQDNLSLDLSLEPKPKTCKWKAKKPKGAKKWQKTNNNDEENE